MDKTLFPLPCAEPSDDDPVIQGKPRLNRPNRGQTEWRPVALDSLLPEDHEARVIWEWVEGIDLSPLYINIRAIVGESGRNAIDPAILLALWLYATKEGVGSARELARLCEEHLAYLWLCGGVSVNYHTLADFRVQHGEFLEQLLITSLAALMAEGLVNLNQVVQDGKKIRASAGSSSFHRKETLDKQLVKARQQVERLRTEVEENPSQTARRQRAARERAAQERQKLLEKAKQQLEKMEKRAEKTGRSKPDHKAGRERRASLTDPEARVMKMANGGFSPAYNAQFCTDAQTNLIVGVQVSQQGNDTGLASPMLEEVQANLGKKPTAFVADTSYFCRDEIVALTEKGCIPYVGIPDKSVTPESRYQPKKDDPKEVAEFRVRMGREEGKEMLKLRGAVAELVHAVMDQWNLDRVRVRGLKKVKTILLWFALVHNWVRTRLLRRKLAAAFAAL